ncbi:MAG TPA: SH3-like domain-containing protein [Acidimicrobiales bacterium]|jgi:nitrile hydratase|nr:SH3-like domain-containing protein [Acidimicrobiales bacterium]
MDGVHDLGGLHGFGRVPVEAEEPFHEPWERRVWAMLGPVLRHTSIDRFRWTIEQMPPAEYLRSAYFERWLFAIERLALELGMVRSDDAPDGGFTSIVPGDPGRRRFALGDRVRTANPVTAGHTRLPRYARRQDGTVVRQLPPWPRATLAAATGRYDDGWEHVYSVEFAAGDLFGDGDHAVSVDVWESDLEPADA